MENKIVITTDAQEREKAFAVRRKVFIEEQHVPEEMEMDEYDQQWTTQHVLLVNQDGQAIGTARFRSYDNGMLKVERVAVLPEHRGTGAGRTIMEAIETKARESGYHCMKLGAQLHAKKFYERLGFQAQGEIYLDAGIEHMDMVKKIGHNA